MNIDWKRKLTSRKLWVALTSFISGLALALGASDSAAAELGGLIMSAASAVAYIIGEGLTDAAAASAVAPIIGEAAADAAGKAVIFSQNEKINKEDTLA